MPMIYSNPAREAETYALPDVWVTQLTAEEIAESMEDAIFDRRRRFPLASFNSREREQLIASIVEEEGVTGGWCWCYCAPGCLPDSGFSVPFATLEEAVADARENTLDMEG